MEALDRRRNNKGQPRKDAADKKKPITVYEYDADIEKLGGITEVRELLKAAIRNALHNIALNS